MANRVQMVTKGFISRNGLGRVGQAEPTFTCDMIKEEETFGLFDENTYKEFMKELYDKRNKFMSALPAKEKMIV